MHKIIEQFKLLPGYQDLISQIRNNVKIAPLGLNKAARIPMLAAVHGSVNRPVLLIVENTRSALALLDDLALYNPDSEHLYFPEPTSLFYENAPWGENTRRQRIMTLTNLASSLIPGVKKTKKPAIIVAPIRAIMAKILPRRDFVKATQLIKPGKKLDPVRFSHDLVRNGYSSTSTVVIPGQFTRRGGIIDIWPPAEDLPTRIDFFGDEVDGLRQFDPATQKTVGKHDRVLIPPAREFILDSTKLQESEDFEWSEFHIPLLHSAPSSLMEYLSKDTIVMCDDRRELRETIDSLEEQAVSLREDYLTAAEFSGEYPVPYLTLPEIEERVGMFQNFELGPSGLIDRAPVALSFSPEKRFGGSLPDLIAYLKEAMERGEPVTVVSRQSPRLIQLWKDNLYALDEESPDFVQGNLSEGFILLRDKKPDIHLLTDGEMFGWERPQPRQHHRLQAETPESGFLEFEDNDLVVHIDHGIGRYKGLVSREMEGTQQEYIFVEYAAGDQLFVPVHQADRLSKYIGSKGHKPSITRLSASDWQSIKSRVKKEVQKVAEDLLELYAKRQIAEGYAFKADTAWQSELEASFSYIETDDQVKVLHEVKTDMEMTRPMDRLICGDVGFGKTEVALRSAFKAVMDGKQVALLVPTTVLAQQHFRTFRRRLSTFPIKVEMLSRFRTAREQREILRELAKGAVDIIIGTHRLISKDVLFNDLGLVIVDEEQRFGVTHKEHFKTLRTEIDVLTLTATPIPRTLYMALTGVRDISTINTPPEERLPIVTHVGPYAPSVVRQAILQELERGGQIFFVHNRVRTIQGMHLHLKKLVPEAMMTVAHGQVKETDLAARMREFSSGEIDVLISTSIIESGLDIPNANTLIVDRADTFGLAQLYQLRGRVGRGSQRAYAFFFKHRTRRATDEGKLRLETLAENTQLGAGFNIAMRDLEIRGAGDFLGTRQHGHIASVGLSLYTRLLTQAVDTIKKSGQLPESMVQLAQVIYPMVNVELPFVSNIPSDYVPERELRIRLYRRLSDIHDLNEIEEMKAEFIDRFGPLPDEAANLFYQLEVKIIAEKSEVSSISHEGNHILVKYPLLPEGIPPRRFRLSGQDLIIGKNSVRLLVKDQDNWRSRLTEVLQELSQNLSS